jgi:hypothetical protein
MRFDPRATARTLMGSHEFCLVLALLLIRGMMMAQCPRCARCRPGRFTAGSGCPKLNKERLGPMSDIAKLSHKKAEYAPPTLVRLGTLAEFTQTRVNTGNDLVDGARLLSEPTK